MKKFILTLLMLIFATSFANAYTVSFDYDGTGSNGSLTDLDEFDFVDVGEWNADAGDFGDVFTYQQSTTGLFAEQFTIKITEGSNSNLGAAGDVDFSPDLYMDVQLFGQYVDNQNIFFNSGSGVFYNDIGGDFNYTGAAGENQIATFSLTNSLVSQLTGTLLGETLGMKIDFTFQFDDIDPNYWGPVEQDLVGKEWLLGFVGTRIEQENLTPGTYSPVFNGSPFTSDQLIEWDLANGQIEFTPVPEPSTFILLGAGIFGLAFYRRKKS